MQYATRQAPTVANLAEGVVLQVQLVQSGANYLLQVLHRGHPAGALLGSKVARLKERLLDGQAFEATVSAINGSLVTLRVQAKI